MAFSQEEFNDAVMGGNVSTTHTDPHIQAEIFPIRADEAAVLHDLGWSSGYGWMSEWDWWMGEENTSDHHMTKLSLISDLTAIRIARYRADQFVARHWKADHPA